MSSARTKRFFRVGGFALGLGIVSVAALWLAIHRVPGFAPMLADTGRKLLGNDAIAWLEDFAYGVEDRVHRWTSRDEAPVAYWDVPTGALSLEPPPAQPGTGSLDLPSEQPLTLPNVGPVHKTWSAPGDGTWVPIHSRVFPSRPAPMFKTLLHPDRNRSWAAVMVIAIELARLDVVLVAGRREPETTDPSLEALPRPAIVPESVQPRLLAAFNGGFKATHGAHGMMLAGVTFLPPKDRLCTLVSYEGGTYALASWSKLGPPASPLLWWRQTPPCMIEGGEWHPGLLEKPDTTAWGATLDKNTVIRRSAVAINQEGTILFAGIGDSVTAGALARAMKHAGGHTVAQLDINWSFPKFLTYEPNAEGVLVAVPLTKNFEFSEGEYVRKPADRDFFYIAEKPSAE